MLLFGLKYYLPIITFVLFFPVDVNSGSRKNKVDNWFTTEQLKTSQILKTFSSCRRWGCGWIMPEAVRVWGNYTLHQFLQIGEALKEDILWKGNMEMTAFFPRNQLPLQAAIVPCDTIPGEPWFLMPTFSCKLKALSMRLMVQKHNYKPSGTTAIICYKKKEINFSQL